MYSKPKLLLQMSKHVNQRSISELILDFIAYEAVQYEEKNMLYLDMKFEIIEVLLDNFAMESDLEVKSILI